MRIALLSMYLPNSKRLKTGGVFYFVHNLANALVDAGNEVTVITLDAKPNDVKYNVITINLPKLFKNSRFYKYYIYPIMLNKVDFSLYDIINSHGDDWALITKRPLLRVFHGSAKEEAKNSKSMIRKINHYVLYMLERFSEFKSVCSLGVSKNTLLDFPQTEKVIYNSISAKFAENKDFQKTTNPTVLFVGTLEGRKRGNELVSQFINEVVPKYPSATLSIVAEKEIKHPNIKSYSAVDEETLIKLYRESWIFCLPSSYEGFGIPYVEAMASESVVVATDNLGAREVLEDGKYGLIVSIGALGKSLLDLIENEDKRVQYVQRGKIRAKDFSMDKIIKQYMEAYRECLN